MSTYLENHSLKCHFSLPIENVHVRLHMFQLQLKSQVEFAIFQQLIFHKHLSSYLKIPVLSNQCQCKTAFAACNICQNTPFRQIEIKLIVYSLPFYFYVRLHIYFDTERNCPLELIVLRYHFVVAFCIIILTVYSIGCYDKYIGNGEHQKLF